VRVNPSLSSFFRYSLLSMNSFILEIHKLVSGATQLLVFVLVFLSMQICASPAHGKDTAVIRIVHEAHARKKPCCAFSQIRWVQVHHKNEDRIFAFSPRISDVSVIVYITGSNIILEPKTPKIRPTSKDDTDPIVIVRKADPSKPYSYKTTGARDFFGTPATKPDLNYLYSLPFAPGKSVCISLGCGEGTHPKGSQYENAIDFAMPINSLVYSARDGQVVSIEDSFDNDGGGPEKFLFANYIVIRHKDGSYAQYGHLKHNGVFPKLGDYVRKNQIIGLSGNTGQSNGPHLHFDVSYYESYGKNISVPVQFESTLGVLRKPTRGMTVTKPQI
jgi:murein DD-endopeptidase MepM/ murein hydrolase activator NlpD